MADLSAHPSSFAPAADESKSKTKRSVLRRALDALMEGQQRRADREIAAILSRRGGIFEEPPFGRNGDDPLPRRDTIRGRA